MDTFLGILNKIHQLVLLIFLPSQVFLPLIMPFCPIRDLKSVSRLDLTRFPFTTHFYQCGNTRPFGDTGCLDCTAATLTKYWFPGETYRASQTLGANDSSHNSLF